MWDISCPFARLTASFTENDRRVNQQTGKAHPGGSAPHHSATRGAGCLWRLGGQDGADGSLADADHSHRQVCALSVRRSERIINHPRVFIDLLLVFLPQGLSRSSVGSGNPQRFAAGDPGSAAGAEGPLSHDDPAAHDRR